MDDLYVSRLPAGIDDPLPGLPEPSDGNFSHIKTHSTLLHSHYFADLLMRDKKTHDRSSVHRCGGWWKWTVCVPHSTVQRQNVDNSRERGKKKHKYNVAQINSLLGKSFVVVVVDMHRNAESGWWLVMVASIFRNRFEAKIRTVHCWGKILNISLLLQISDKNHSYLDESADTLPSVDNQNNS